MIIKLFASLYSRAYFLFIYDTVRLYRVTSPQIRSKMVVLLFLQVCLGILELITIYSISFFALSVAAPEQALNIPTVRSFLNFLPWLDNLFQDQRIFIIIVGCIMLAFVLVKNLFAGLIAYSTAGLTEKLSVTIGSETLLRFLNKGYFWHISPAAHDVLVRLGFRTSLSSLLDYTTQLYSNTICTLFLFGGMFLAIPGLTTAVIFIVGCLGLLIYLFIKRRVDRASAEKQTVEIKDAALLIAIHQGIREIIIYRQQKAFHNTIDANAERGIAPKVILNIAGMAPVWLLEPVGFLMVILVLGVMFVTHYSLPAIIQAITMLMLTAWRILPSINKILANAVNIRSVRPNALACLELLENFMQESPEPLPEPDPCFRLTESIQLEDVSFCYPAAAHNIINHVSLTIKKGERVGLIGLSGSGKSTLALLLCGLFDPNEGRLLVDHAELSGSQKQSLVRMVGFIPQNPVLIAGSIAENVAFSQYGQKPDRSRIELACRKAAMDFVFEHEEGIDYKVANGGVGLSGGQIQRVAVARALFADPSLLVFDEATSSLDQASENLIKDTIRNLEGDITTIVIAHRLTTVEDCDTVIWMENGRIREIGKPHTILPLYAEYIDKYKS